MKKYSMPRADKENNQSLRIDLQEENCIESPKGNMRKRNYFTLKN